MKGDYEMGLIKVLGDAVSGTLANQWLEYYYCDSLPPEVLMKEAQKKTSNRNSNTKGDANIIQNGSRIAVADGQCMIVMDGGKVKEVCAESGEYTYDSGKQSSIFYGGLGKGLVDSFHNFADRFAFGGEVPGVQKVYYFNTKEILNNMYGTPNPVMFRARDKEYNISMTCKLRINGTYTYRITDPIAFYINLAGNIKGEYRRSEIDQQLKNDFIDALGPSLSVLAKIDMLPDEIPFHTPELKEAMNSMLTDKWATQRGITIESIQMNPPSLTPEDLQKLQDMQSAATLGGNAAMMAGTMTAATAAAMQDAAKNSAGAMTGFMGMGFAQQAGSPTVNNLAAMSMQQQGQQPQQTPPPAAPAAAPAAAGVAGAVAGWTCPKCGKSGNTGKFCADCGEKRPEEDSAWTCECGAKNQGKFCQECGKPKPAGAPLYKCDKCGWEPEDPYHPPKFCPECGDIFDENDKV